MASGSEATVPSSSVRTSSVPRSSPSRSGRPDDEAVDDTVHPEVHGGEVPVRPAEHGEGPARHVLAGVLEVGQLGRQPPQERQPAAVQDLAVLSATMSMIPSMVPGTVADRRVGEREVALAQHPVTLQRHERVLDPDRRAAVQDALHQRADQLPRLREHLLGRAAEGARVLARDDGPRTPRCRPSRSPAPRTARAAKGACRGRGLRRRRAAGPTSRVRPGECPTSRRRRTRPRGGPGRRTSCARRNVTGTAARRQAGPGSPGPRGWTAAPDGYSGGRPVPRRS